MIQFHGKWPQKKSTSIFLGLKQLRCLLFVCFFGAHFLSTRKFTSSFFLIAAKFVHGLELKQTNPSIKDETRFHRQGWKSVGPQVQLCFVGVECMVGYCEVMCTYYCGFFTNSGQAIVYEKPFFVKLIKLQFSMIWLWICKHDLIFIDFAAMKKTSKFSPY